MSEVFPNSKIEITVIYQRTGLPQEVRPLSISTKDNQDHYMAYSRFKSTVCRLFLLPKSTPFMLKDSLTGTKMTRDKFSEFLTSKKFPLVWVLITALLTEDGSNKLLLSHMDSCTTTATTESTDTIDLSPKENPPCFIDINSMHSKARALSLGWNEHTNTYGLETRSIQLPTNHLVFISKRAPNLSIPTNQSDLCVGDLILKIEDRSVGEMTREEIGLHLNYPLANLDPLALSVLTWTDTPQDVRDIILQRMGYDMEPINNELEPYNQRLPSTHSEPNFWSVPISSVDDSFVSPCSSPRKRKMRQPLSSCSATELVSSQTKSSPNKKLGIIIGPKPRNRSLSSCCRSDSFAFVPSDPLASCPVSEPAVFSPIQPPDTSQIGLLADSAENIPELVSVAMVANSGINNVSSPLYETHQSQITADSNSQKSQTSADSNSRKSQTSADSNSQQQTRVTADSNSQQQTRVTTDSHSQQQTRVTADSHSQQSQVTADSNSPKSQTSVDSNSQKSQITADSNSRKSQTSADSNSRKSQTSADSNSRKSQTSADSNSQQQSQVTAVYNSPKSQRSADSNSPESQRSADSNLPKSQRSADSNSPKSQLSADLKLANCDPEATLVPCYNILSASQVPEYIKLEPSSRPADLTPEILHTHPIIEPQLTLVPFDTNPEPNLLTVKYSRSASDSKTNRIYRDELSSSSSDMDTEDVAGMYYVTDPPELEEEYNMINHPFEPFDDTFEPQKPSSHLKLPSKHSNPTKLSREKLDHFRRFLSSNKSGNYIVPQDMPLVSDNNTTIVSSSCTEFVNPSFQSSVHGVYRSFNRNQSRRPLSKRHVSHLDTFNIDTLQQTKSSNEISFNGFSSDESDYETDMSHFHTSRHRTALPIGLITPIRPRKLALGRDPPDTRPVSENSIPRSNSEASNLGTNCFYEDQSVPLEARTRMARKQKTMLLSTQTEGYFGGTEGAGLSNGRKGETKQSLYSGKPAEFIHPAYRPYQSFGNMEINEKMCLRLKEKFQPISTGPLSRKHEYDGRMRRKAADRSWKSLYVQLHESDLIFYKAECGFQQDRPFLKTLSRDRSDHTFQYDHIVSLHHAKLYIPNDYMAHKRNTTSYVFRFETENTSTYLVRAISLPLMFGWILSFMEARNLPPTDHPHSTGLFQESEKRRRNTIEGANKYLSKLQQKMKSKLFMRRESEVLFEPIFANSIIRCARARENEKVPLLVEMCVKEIEERALESEGIYRVSGTARHIKSLRDDMSKGVDVDPDDDRWADQNNIAGLLKLFFKELTEPLVSSDLYNTLIGTTNKETSSQGQLIKEIQTLVQTMPDANLTTLDYIVAHLCRVAQYSSVNRMSIKNLAIVFGPTLITRRDLTSIELISQTNCQVAIMELLIVHYDHVFSLKPINERLFDSRRCPSSISHSIFRASKNSNSFVTERSRRVSSTEPPTPSTTPPPPYPEIHITLESKLSRSWSEEVLSSASLIGESFGSDLFRSIPLTTLNTSSTLPRGVPHPNQDTYGETTPHPLCNTLWHIPLDNIAPSMTRSSRSDHQKNSTFF